MDKFRVISDLHLDINERYPLELKDKDVFTVVCGDTAGETELGIEWIKKNVRRGIIVNGNHLPYGNACRDRRDLRTMDELRALLKREFPVDSDVSYLDAEIGEVAKEVDGILFLGSCFYTNFRISEPTWNPKGNQRLNMANSEYRMNDYRMGYVKREFPTGADGEPGYVRMKPADLNRWFCNAFGMMDKALDENEKSEKPKPVVMATHYPLVKDYLLHNWYVESPNEITSMRDFMWGSYASDLKRWLKRHPSLKCYCSGHIHDVENDYRYYGIRRKDADDLLLVHNVRGYVGRGHARWFNPDTFVDTKTWKAFETPLTEEEENARKKPSDEYFSKCMAWGIF